MNPEGCAGLIACTPVPTLAPAGLTPAEVLTLGTVAGNLTGLFVLMLLVVLAVTATAVAWAATR